MQVRLTHNYHTGGTVELATRAVPAHALRLAQRIVRDLPVPLIGVDFLIDRATRRTTVIEVSPDMAISPPEGALVAERFLDVLFPETATGNTTRRRPSPLPARRGKKGCGMTTRNQNERIGPCI